MIFFTYFVTNNAGLSFKTPIYKFNLFLGIILLTLIKNVKGNFLADIFRTFKNFVLEQIKYIKLSNKILPRNTYKLIIVYTNISLVKINAEPYK